MLENLTWHEAPYALFTVQDTFSEVRCAELDALFESDVPWARHDDHFYECEIAVVTERLDPTWLEALRLRIIELTGLELTEASHVTIQRMSPGDHLDRHSDRPLLGYEAFRLVLQIDRDWSTADGGLFRAFDGEHSVVELLPSRNGAAGFALTTESFHEVQTTHRMRRSAVFNFWHPGNSPAVERLVRGLFEGMSFAALPEAVDELARAAEAERSEEDTYRAASVAFLLSRWGYEADEAAVAYRRALDGTAVEEVPTSELDAAIDLAGWFVHLHSEHFETDRWLGLRRRFRELKPARFPRLRDAWLRAFPPTR